jgi:hypothetical protein
MKHTGTVLARLADDLLVDVDGRSVLVANELLNGVRVGDRVMIRRGWVVGPVVPARTGRPRPARAETTAPGTS